MRAEQVAEAGRQIDVAQAAVDVAKADAAEAFTANEQSRAETEAAKAALEMAERVAHMREAQVQQRFGDASLTPPHSPPFYPWATPYPMQAYRPRDLSGSMRSRRRSHGARLVRRRSCRA